MRVLLNLEVIFQSAIDSLIVDRLPARFSADGFLNRPAVLNRDVLRLRCFVSSRAANSRQDFGRDPALEALGGIELRSEDQGVETGFIDGVDRLAPAVGFNFDLDQVFGVDVVLDGLSRIGVTECAANVQSDEKRGFGCAERAHGVVLEREAEGLHESLLCRLWTCRTTPIVAAELAGWRTVA